MCACRLQTTIPSRRTACSPPTTRSSASAASPEEAGRHAPVRNEEHGICRGSMNHPPPPGENHQRIGIVGDPVHSPVHGQAEPHCHFGGPSSVPIPGRAVFTGGKPMELDLGRRHQPSARKSDHAVLPSRSAKRRSSSSARVGSSSDTAKSSAGIVPRSRETRVHRSPSGNCKAASRIASGVHCMVSSDFHATTSICFGVARCRCRPHPP
jgi:hypothetical protein